MAGGSHIFDRGDAGRQYAGLGRTQQLLQIRLTVVDSCSDDTGGARCTAPHQRSDTPQLPSQVRELAPPATDENATPAVTLIY